MGMRDGTETPWAVVLAAGDGTRLRSMTTTAEGLVVPKQFCSFGGPRTLLGATLERAWDLVPSERILAVVAEAHRSWWQPQLQGLPSWNVVVQPANRGTAAGLALPLMQVADQDPDAVILVLPSDHHVEDPAPLNAAWRQAVRAARRDPQSIVLLGIVPDEPDSEYGWIVPGPRGETGLRRVESFVEKPDRATAAHLLAGGALWSSFMMAGSARAFLALVERAVPDLARRLRQHRLSSGADLSRLYANLECADFSRDVLQRVPEALSVLPVAECGWSDLGTPERVVRWLNRRGLLAPAHAVASVRAPMPRSAHATG